MTTQRKKIVDALKRLPAQKSAFIKVNFGKQGACVETDLLSEAEKTEVMKHLSGKQKLLN